MIDAFYDQLPDAPPDSLYSKRIIRDMAVTYYGFCMGVINE
ncbi:hypothetical protein HALO59_160186 [Halomonas sp. 59]|nr:hypothetical protein HALO113_160828 [Halomonas sp. 113]CAD5265752.1 hypothetical protein HALO59_160186 [Halomonas sp. 59]CAD5278499.1 hypothetical protein HALOI3_210185 [Halomonas sp. I3]CAD5284450.1 hypothetical protein HALO156_30005 [Halomonas sp. 156]